VRIKVWDLPTRVFHWLLFITVTASLLTGLEGGNWMTWHARLGLLALGLLVFRLVWGILGSTYARFANFAPTPSRILAYLRGRWHGLGHNPLGALSVFALLALLLWQAGSGLFTNDDIAFDGPLYGLVSKSTSDWLSSLHRQGLWLIVGLVALHILAALYYTFVRGNNLIRPMVTGYKESAGADARPARGGPLWALLLALTFAGGSVWVANGGLLPPPPPPAPVPAW
jgi:cytochrome b